MPLFVTSQWFLSLSDVSFVIQTKEQLVSVLKSFDAVVVGPGPGSPANPDDMGMTTALWELPDDKLLPVFGVCLGMQSLGLFHGGSIHRLRAPQHGRLAPITHDGTDIFENVPSGAIAVRYHSLHVSTGPEIIPLAWVTDPDDGKVLMAAKHNTRPFWGVQYHPESISTSPGGAMPIANFFLLAHKWLKESGRPLRETRLPAWFTAVSETYPFVGEVEANPTLAVPQEEIQVHTELLEGNTLSGPQICELLGVANHGNDFIMLDSAASPGRFSIIAALTSESPRMEHFVGNDFVTVTVNYISKKIPLNGQAIWDWLEAFMKTRPVARNGSPELPFWGGLVGSFTYEAGVDALQIEPILVEGRPADTSLIFVERSIVIDHSTNRLYVQSIHAHDDAWVTDIKGALADYDTPLGETIKHTGKLEIQRQDIYKEQFRQCQEFLAAGESYELCLTAQAKLTLKPTAGTKQERSWNFYRRLRARNPAPFAAYMRIGKTTFVGSSPERFLSWDRDGRSELRPIKGTVKKQPDGSVTREHAEKILSSDKEIAENLMIVDLIRHDLLGRALPDTVTVSQLMGVEEYERVFQLVSVIEGKVDVSHAFELLRTSLPPGSMTGAPKKRSVEILQRLEGIPRGVYSGVVGYWCCGGGADWSVVIRSSVNTGVTGPEGEDVWNIGAGGAITILSDAQGEWDEMETKLGSVLSALG